MVDSTWFLWGVTLALCLAGWFTGRLIGALLIESEDFRVAFFATAIIAPILLAVRRHIQLKFRLVTLILVGLMAVVITAQTGYSSAALARIDAFERSVIYGSYESIQISDEGVVDVEIGPGNCLEIDPSKLDPDMFRFYRNSDDEYDNMGVVGGSYHITHLQICDGYIRLV